MEEKKKNKHKHENKHEEKPNTSKNDNVEVLQEEHFRQEVRPTKEEELKKEVEKLTEENKKLTEKVQLGQAELINYRKRKDEEVSNMLKYANSDSITDLLGVVDNLERAIKHANSSNNAEVKKYNEGVSMIYDNLNSILTKFDVSVINRVGEVFDPTIEAALLTDSVSDKPNDVVLEVLQKGYKLKDRVIRPASVKINQNNNTNKDNNNKDKDNK